MVYLNAIIDVFILTIIFRFGNGTIDMNLSELQYLADHLRFDECRKLVAALHFKSYEKPNALDQAERKVNKGVPCIQMLLHWNSQAGEGKGETHEAVEHRLRQLGRYDLADWLGRTVFHQLGKDLDNSLDEPFSEMAEMEIKTHKYSPKETYQPLGMFNPSEWTAFDTICYALVASLAVATIAALVIAFYMLACKRIRSRRKIRFSRAKYRELERFTSDSGSESEDRFDVRKELART